MDNLLMILKQKAQKHEEKIKVHKRVEDDLRGEYNLLSNDDKRKDYIGEKLEITIRAIEYHKGSSKTYLKAYNMIVEENDNQKAV